MKDKTIKNKKKIALQWSVGLMITGGAAAAIGVPVANAVKSKARVYIDPITSKTPIYEGKTDDEANKNNKNKSVSKGNLVDEAMKPAAFYLYKEEAAASWEAQARDLKFQHYQAVESKKEEIKGLSGESLTKKTKEYDKKIKEIKEKIDKLATFNTIAKKKEADISNYPKVFKSIETLTETERKKLDDEKNVFIKTYSTEVEGEREWIKSLNNNTKYGNSSNETEAISHLIYQIIKEKSLLSYKISLESNFTVGKAISTYEGKYIYDFLIDNKITSSPKLNNSIYTHDDITDDKIKSEKNSTAKIVSTLTKKDKKKKIYFVSTKSNIGTKILVTLNETNKKIIEVSKQKIISLSHALIAAKNDAKSNILNWKIEKKSIVDLFKIEQMGTGLSLLTNDLFDKTTKAKENKTKQFIKQHSGNSDSTKTKSGHLGFGNMFELLESMAPGFTMGILAGYDSVATTDSGKLAALKNALTTARDEWFGDKEANWDQKSLENVLEQKTDKEIEIKFGSIFKRLFYGNEGQKLFYPISLNKSLVISNFGLHIVKIDKYDNAQDVAKHIKTQLETFGKDQDTTKSKLDLAKLLKNSYSDDAIISELLTNDSNFKTEIERGYNIEDNKKTIKDLKTYKDDDGNKKNWTIVNNDIHKKILNNNYARKQSQFNKTVGSKVTSFVLEGIKNKTLNKGKLGITPGSKTLWVILKELYDKIKKVGGTNV